MMKDHLRNSKMIEKNNGKLVRFADLPVNVQDALIHYMSVDGEAWAFEKKWPDWVWGEGTPQKPKQRRKMLADIEKFRPRFIEHWGEKMFGLVEIPTNELLESIFQDDHFVGDYDDYKKQTEEGFDDDWEYDRPTWPVILSDFPEETLQDGWTRFHRYCQLGVEKIVCVFYPD